MYFDQVHFLSAREGEVILTTAGACCMHRLFLRQHFIKMPHRHSSPSNKRKRLYRASTSTSTESVNKQTYPPKRHCPVHVKFMTLVSKTKNDSVSE